MQAVPAEVAHPATLPEPLAEVEPPPTPVPGHDEASEAMVEAAVVSPRLPETDTETLPAKRSRRGGRRRRKPGEEAEMGAAAGAEAPAGAPAYVGPTPADPFALQGGDMFDLAETPPPPPAPRRAPSRRAKAAPVAVAPPPAEESAPELLAPELLAPGTPATGTPATETPAAEAPVIALESSVVRPVLIGAGEAAAEKKRGWWRK
jgi:ribonuclease E